MIALLALSLLVSLTTPEMPASEVTNAQETEAQVRFASAEIATCLNALDGGKLDASKVTADGWVIWTVDAPTMESASPRIVRTPYKRDGSPDFIVITEGPGQLSCQVFSSALADKVIQARVIQELDGVVRQQDDTSIVVSMRDSRLDVIFINEHGGSFGLALVVRAPRR